MGLSGLSGLSGLGVAGQRSRTYAEKVLATRAANLIGYWPFQETSGTVITDASPKARNGSYRGSGEPVLNQTGPLSDKAIQFDGNNDYGNLFSAGLASDFNGNEGGLSLWAQLPLASSWTDTTTRYLFYMPVDGSNSIFVRRQSTNLIVANWAGSAVGKAAQIATSTLNWFHVMLVWSATAGQVKGWFNGQPCTWPSAGQPAFVGTPVSSIIGATTLTGTSAYKGLLAHLALWNTAPKSADIAVLANRRRHIIFDGDSRTVGAAVSTSYPTQCLALADMVALDAGFENIGVSGQTVLQMSSDATTQVDGQIRSELQNYYVLFGGLNDAHAAASAETIYSRIASLADGRRKAGHKVAVLTEIDSQSSASNAVSWSSSLRADLNTRLRNGASQFCDVLIDVGADSRLSDANNTTYYNADKQHLITAGNAVLAELVAAQLIRI